MSGLDTSQEPTDGASLNAPAHETDAQPVTPAMAEALEGVHHGEPPLDNGAAHPEAPQPDVPADS